MGTTGGVGHGFEDPKDNGAIEDEFVWTNSRKEDIYLKDRVKIDGPDSFDNITHVRNEAGEWEVQENSERCLRAPQEPAR